MISIQSIAKNYNPEIALAVLFLRMKLSKSGNEELGEYLRAHPVDIVKFLSLVEAHQIENLVNSANDFRDINPEMEEIKKFKNWVEYRARFNMVLFDELINLYKNLKGHNNTILFYKGVLLSKLLFDDFTTRSTADIDVLIDAENFLSIREILLRTGYEEVYYYPADYHDYYLKVNREALFRKKNLSGKMIFIELQWAPLSSMFRWPFDNKYFFQDTDSLQIVGEKIPLINIEKHLIILFLHHGISDLWRNLKLIFDIVVLAERYKIVINWSQVENDIIKCHFRKNAEIGINLCEKLFDVSIPLFIPRQDLSKETEAVFSSLMHYPLLEKKKKSISNISRQLYLSDNISEKIHLLKGYMKLEIMPSMIDLQYLKLPPALFPLYYITKRFRFLFK